MGKNNKFHLYYNSDRIESGFWKRYKGGGGEKEKDKTLEDNIDDKNDNYKEIRDKFKGYLIKLKSDFSLRYNKDNLVKREKLNITPFVYIKIVTVKKKIKSQSNFFKELGMDFVSNDMLLSEFIVKFSLEKFENFVENLNTFIEKKDGVDFNEIDEKLLIFDNYQLLNNNDRSNTYYDYNNKYGVIKIHLFKNTDIKKFLHSLRLLNNNIEVKAINDNIIELDRDKLNENDLNTLFECYDSIKKISSSNMNFKVDNNGNVINEKVSLNIADSSTKEIVCIVDSGIEQSVLKELVDANPLINVSLIGSTPLEDLKKNIGHGTNVASIAIFGNQIHNDHNGKITPICKVCSLQVIGDSDITSVCYRDIVDSIKNIHINSGGKVKVFNLSFSSDVLKNNEISDFSFALDTIMHEYDILCVIASGNSYDNDIFDYPFGWVRHDSNFTSPAESINALTVGSIGCKHYGDNYVSYYSRRNNIQYPNNFSDKLKKYNKKKPDLLAFGGHKDNEIRTLSPLNSIVELYGTSFAAPYITHLASILRNVYGNITMNSVKGLILNNCEDLYSSINVGLFNSVGVDVDRIYGNGIIKSSKINSGEFAFSSDNRVTILIESDIDFSDYEFNSYPYLTTKIKMPVFKNIKEYVVVKATLCYNPLVNNLSDNLSDYNTCFMAFKFHCGDSDFKHVELEGKIVSELTKFEGQSWSALPYKNYFWNNSQTMTFLLRKNEYNELVKNNLSITIRSLLKENNDVIDWYKDNKQKFSLVITIEELGEEGNLYDYIKSENELSDIIENDIKNSSNLKLKG